MYLSVRMEREKFLGIRLLRGFVSTKPNLKKPIAENKDKKIVKVLINHRKKPKGKKLCREVVNNYTFNVWFNEAPGGWGTTSQSHVHRVCVYIHLRRM